LHTAVSATVEQIEQRENENQQYSPKRKIAEIAQGNSPEYISTKGQLWLRP
jgi:hypothetical protein